jgi:hypothetical protein
VTCGLCGAQTPEGDFICAECASRGDVRRDVPEVEAPVGVKGWLLFFCISLTVLSPVSLVVDFDKVRRELEMNLAGEPATQPLISVYRMLNVSIAIVCIAAGVMLWSKRPRAVRVAKIALLYYVCSLGPISLLAYLVGMPSEIARAWALSILQSLPLSLPYPLIWFLYLSYSKRVRATFPDEFEQQVHTGSAT